MELKVKELKKLIREIGQKNFYSEQPASWDISEEHVKSFPEYKKELFNKYEAARKELEECNTILKKEKDNNAAIFNRNEAFKKFHEIKPEFILEERKYILEKLLIPEYNLLEITTVANEEVEITYEFIYKDNSKIYLTFDSTYNSWDGYDFYDIRETAPIEKTIIVYENV